MKSCYGNEADYGEKGNLRRG